MALPGLGDEDVPELTEQEPVLHELAANTEWRFEVAFTETVEVKLVSGSAELFGTELAPQHTYSFRGTKGAIYTHYGCVVSSLGVLQSDYIAEETPMTQYVNLHLALDGLRASHAEKGPRILVLGPPNAGKTSLCKTLCAYALRSGSSGIIAVNLDPRQGLCTLPGTLSAVALEDGAILDIEAGASGWGSAPTNGPMPVPVKLPLVYYYGHPDPESDASGYTALVSRLALGVVGRMNEDTTGARQAGCIVDTPRDMSLELVEHAVMEFGIDVIVVLGSERVYSDVARRFVRQQAEGLQVVKLDRSGGTVDRDAMWWARARQEEVHEYFYGDVRVALSPHSIFVEFGDVALFKLVDPNAGSISSGFLPGGELPDPGASAAKVFERISEPTPELHNAILTIMNAEPNASAAEIRNASVIGFVHVAEIDDKRKRLKLLAPLSGHLPRRTLVWGKFPEQMELDAGVLR